MKKQEPKWITDAAKTMLQPTVESYGDEDQNEIMDEIKNYKPKKQDEE